MKRVFLCSRYTAPTTDEIGMNVMKAQRALRLLMDRFRFAVFAPHLIYPAIFKDNEPGERALGIEAGKEFLAICESMVLFRPDGVISKGMWEEIRCARAHYIPIRELKIAEDGNASLLGFEDDRADGSTIAPS